MRVEELSQEGGWRETRHLESDGIGEVDDEASQGSLLDSSESASGRGPGVRSSSGTSGRLTDTIASIKSVQKESCQFCNFENVFEGLLVTLTVARERERQRESQQRERETETERETERERDRERQRERDRERESAEGERETERETERDRDRERETERVSRGRERGREHERQTGEPRRSVCRTSSGRCCCESTQSSSR
jgi:hypothetical protein